MRIFCRVSLVAALVLSACGGDDNVNPAPLDAATDGTAHDAAADMAVMDATRTDASDASPADAAAETSPQDASPEVSQNDASPEASSDGGPDTADAGCSSPSDCPATGTPCVVAVCAMGMCSTSNAAAGTACAVGSGVVCNGAGMCVQCNSIMDCPASPTACVQPTCSMGTCGTANAPVGTTCTDSGGVVCNGTGMCVQCNSIMNCPLPPTACVLRTCSMGACGTTNAAAETVCMDSGGVVCNGFGTCVQCNTVMECPPSPTLCATPACSAGACSRVFAPLGAACSDSGGIVCNGAGTCVQCNTNMDCPSLYCMNHMCIAATCMDLVKDGQETDVDCGGPVCIPCANGKMCFLQRDCTSAVCTGNVCQAPTCSDNVKNGQETDVDCGGPTCPACAMGKTCFANTDCISGMCVGNHCQ